MITLASLAAAYGGGTPVGHVLADVLARIDPADPVWIAPAQRAAVVERARMLDALDPKGRAALPLFGVPYAVKDNIDVAGMPTTAGCPAFAYIPNRSATVVERLDRAGAVFVGKTNLDQFATGLVGTRSPYGVPINPFHPSYIPGGSSSGSAVAVARGLVAFALGTDTAGSGRIPAAFTATVGVKPTHGLISAAGVVPACRSLDCVSIFAPCVADASAVLSVAAAPDERDPFSRRPTAERPAISASFSFGVPQPNAREFFGDVQAEAAFDAAVGRLAALGGTAVPIDMAPCFEAAGLLYDGPFVAERTAAVGDFIDTHPADVLDVTRTIIASGRRFSAADAFSAVYRIRELRALLQDVFAGIALLVVPTAPTTYRLADIAADPYGCNARLGTYTNFVNLLDLCALALPAGRYANGMPIGVTFIAPAFGDAALAAFAGRFTAPGGDERQ